MFVDHGTHVLIELHGVAGVHFLRNPAEQHNSTQCEDQAKYQNLVEGLLL